MKVRRLAPVDAEVLDALAYYSAIDPALGLRFTKAFEEAIQRIAYMPSSWRPIGQSCRRYALQTFPYIVIYALLEDEVVIVAFAHTHRRPNYWRERL